MGAIIFFCGCNQIYKNTNERLKDIYEQFDFSQKNVFSVLSSSDQTFSAYYFEANNVDTFDNNWTTYYYFYLKKWYLMYYHEHIIDTKSKKLLNSLSMYDISCEEERKVYNVWKDILLKYNEISQIFYSDNFYDWNLPYNQDVTKLINTIKYKQANFTELNIFKKIQTRKKYDIIVLSNILENVHPESEFNMVLCQNLNSILNENGIAICSILNDRYKDCKLVNGRKTFSTSFNYEVSQIRGYNNRLNKDMPLYYVYKKK